MHKTTAKEIIKVTNQAPASPESTTNVKVLHEATAQLMKAMCEEATKLVLASKMEEMIDASASDISARYWLTIFLAELNRTELKSIVDGFLVPLLNEDQCKKLVKFLLVRFPQYYAEETGAPKPDEPALTFPDLKP
jgi:phosphoribosyl-ATP pyrophosphohydrolase